MSRVGHYEIVQRLAAGGMAEVFLVLDRRTTPPAVLAMKRIRPDASGDKAVAKMLIDEGRLTARLMHRGIARTVDVGEHDGGLYLVMEFVDGRDFGAILTAVKERGERLPPALAALITLRAAEALDYAHRLRGEDGAPLNVVHRDVSPSNVMVAFSGEVRLIDFGIARAEKRLTETHTGIVKGKYRYMAPEQALGKAVDARADVYSLGITLYEALAGDKVLPQLSEMELLAAVIHSQIPALRSVAKDAPPGLARIVARAMEPDLAARFQSCALLATELRSWLASSVTHALGPAELAAMMDGLFPGQSGATSAVVAKAG